MIFVIAGGSRSDVQCASWRESWPKGRETCLPQCLPVRDVPGGISWSYTTLHEHKNGGPARTRRLWRPVLLATGFPPSSGIRLPTTRSVHAPPVGSVTRELPYV